MSACTRARCRLLRTVTCVALATLGVAVVHAGSASAYEIVVYGSPADDGVPVPGGVYPLYGVPSQPIPLWMVGGPVQSDSLTEPCVDGDGGEVCGIQFNVHASLGATLKGWESDPEWSSSDGMRVFFSSTRITAQGFVLGAPPSVAPRRLGIIYVDSVGAPDGELFVDGEGIQADLGRAVVWPNTFAVPEPSFGSGLVAGVMALGVLVRRRRSRR
jgi:hypothetical protein